MPIIAHGGDPEKALRQQRAFYESIGRAIGQWAFVEDNIWHTYRVIIEPKDWASAASAFHAVINQNSRLDMIQAAISTSRRYQHRADDWILLRKKIRKLAKRRARLAHWTPVQVGDPDEDSGGPIFLQPPSYDFTKRNEDGGTEKIYTKQIIQWSSGFTRLGMAVDGFWRSLTSPEK